MPTSPVSTPPPSYEETRVAPYPTSDPVGMPKPVGVVGEVQPSVPVQLEPAFAVDINLAPVETLPLRRVPRRRRRSVSSVQTPQGRNLAFKAIGVGICILIIMGGLLIFMI